MRRLTCRRSSGQSTVLFALLLPVLLGMLALTIDLGFAMSQRRGVQNAADAGTMAGAQLMAASVTQTETLQGQPRIAYDHLPNHRVHDRVRELVEPNRLVTGPTFVYATAVQFRTCAGASLGYTQESDPALVTALGGTRLATSSENVPINTCSLKVHRQATFPTFFARIMGIDTQTVATQAAARVAPTTPPTQLALTNVWPLSHWSYPDDCRERVGAICTFWTSSAPPGGSFKETINLSRYSDLFGAPRTQHWVDYDHRWPGNTGQIPDLQEWIRHGWQGSISVNESDPRCLAANLACPNSKFEIYGGNNGNNIASMMTAYINDHTEGIDPSLGKFATVSVFFWRYGEQNINAATNVGQIWGGTANPTTENPNNLQRVILQKVRRYRFYTSTVESSSVRGYFVSFYNGNGTPQSGPPSSVSNTVLMTTE